TRRLGLLWTSDPIVLEGHEGHVRSVAFSPDGKTLASGSQDQSVQIWDVSGSRPHERGVLRGDIGVLRLIMFPPDGKTLLAVGARGGMVLWDFHTRTKLREWMLPKEEMVSSVAMTYDGRYLATGNSDGNVNIFRLYPKKTDS